MVNRANDIAFAKKHGMSLEEYDDYIDRKGHSGEPRFTQKYRYTNHGWASNPKPRSLWDDIMDQFKPKRKSR
jgi:hypothetical protein